MTGNRFRKKSADPLKQGVTVLDKSLLQSKIRYLSALDLFQDLSKREIEAIDRVTVMRHYKAGEVFFKPGETAEQMFILKKGEVEIYHQSARGRKLLLAKLRPLTFFGEMICIGQGMYQRYARATKDSLICTMNRVAVRRLLLSKPRVALRLLEAMGKQMISAERRLHDFAFKEAISRIAALLLREARGNEVQGLRHQDIADQLGIYRETVTDTLAQLKAGGLIAIHRTRITILDRERLAMKTAEE